MPGRWIIERVVFAGVPLLVLIATVVGSVRDRSFAIDFDTVSSEIRGLVHGTSPYMTERLAEGGHFLWPILAGLVLLPLAWLPYSLGDVVFTAAQVGCLVGALRLFSVRDWRIYGLVLAWPATVNSVQTANLTLPMCFLLAFAWHQRDRARCGLWAGLAIAIKFLAWPVLVWLAATRRWKAILVALGVQAVGVLVAVPYVTPSEYISFERTVASTFERDSLTLTALLEDGGVSHPISVAATLVLGLAVLVYGRRDYGLSVVAALVLTPVAWLHYFDLLLVPLAVWRPPLWVWWIPVLLVVTPGQGNGAPWRTAATLVIAVAAIVLGYLFRSDTEIRDRSMAQARIAT